MRYRHFDQLQPVCPRCLQVDNASYPLVISSRQKEQDNMLIQGILCCSNPHCCQEYPVIDGIPIIVPNVRQFLNSQLLSIAQRDDLPAELDSLLGDSCTADEPYNLNRQYLSTYAWDHYGQTQKRDTLDEQNTAGSLARCLLQGLALFPDADFSGPVIDLGCATGGGSLIMADKLNHHDADTQLVLGVDLNFAMLRFAHKVQHDKNASFPLRRIGQVYDQVSFNCEDRQREQVDFWACDATALPFADASFGVALALNLLDSVASPPALLAALRSKVRLGGRALLSTPFDWASRVTPIESWIGGHSQRSPHRGEGDTLLHTLLAQPVNGQQINIVDEINRFPWHNRIHSRSSTHYQVQLLALEIVGKKLANT